MGLLKELIDVDSSNMSVPWTEKKWHAFRKHIQENMSKSKTKTFV